MPSATGGRLLIKLVGWLPVTLLTRVYQPPTVLRIHAQASDVIISPTAIKFLLKIPEPKQQDIIAI